MKFKEIVKTILTQGTIPLTPDEISDIAKQQGLLNNSNGHTPEKTIGAILYKDIKDNGTNSAYIQVTNKPPRFCLRNHQNTMSTTSVATPVTQPAIKNKFHERDLHRLLSSFVQVDPHFRCATRTIFHEKSAKQIKGKNHWLHPDIVGIYYPHNDLADNIVKIVNMSGEKVNKLFSFELKTELNMSNVRECYFQAVSNSSWSHEGYLVTLKINQESEVLDELRSLNNRYGIGVIRLNPQNISQSEIPFVAKEQSALDRYMMQRLVEENTDFEEFLEDVINDAQNGRNKLRGAYDEYFDDDEIAEYSKQMGII